MIGTETNKHRLNRSTMDKPDITVEDLPMALRYHYKAFECDCSVYMRCGDMHWRGLCSQEKLQECIEYGLSLWTAKY